jgi:hypothetical protein
LAVDPDALVAELRSLRKGLATRHPALVKQLGPQVTHLCKITGKDGPAAARRKIVEVVESLLHDQPRQVQLAITAAFALNQETDQRHLGARERWLAEQLNCHERTARRRVDEAIEILVRLAAEADWDRDYSDAWQVQSIRALLRLDGPSPELTEQRTIMIVADSVNGVVTRFSLPRAEYGIDESHDVVTEILYGGRIRDYERLSEEHFRYFIEFPRSFHRGETHDYGIRFRVPPRQAMAPHYAMVPLLTIKSLDLTIRFDQTRLPTMIWRLDGVAPRMIDNNMSPGTNAILHADRFGEVRLSFRNLRQGFGYGARWQLRDERA